MRALPADSLEYFDDTLPGNTAPPDLVVAVFAPASAGASRARHSFRKSVYFLSPTVLSAFILFHSSLQAFMRLCCALAGAAESMRPAQTATAENAASFFMALPR